MDLIVTDAAGIPTGSYASWTLDLAHIDFASIYERTNGLPDYAPGTTLPSDHVLSRGTGQYHHTKHTTALP